MKTSAWLALAGLFLLGAPSVRADDGLARRQDKERLEHFLANHPRCGERWRSMSSDQRKRLLERLRQRREALRTRLKDMSPEQRQALWKERRQRHETVRTKLRARLDQMTPKEREEWLRKHPGQRHLCGRDDEMPRPHGEAPGEGYRPHQDGQRPPGGHPPPPPPGHGPRR